MDLNRLEIFYEVAKAGSIAKSNIRVSPSVASRYIKELEEEYGKPLFYRKSSGFELTGVGVKLLEHVTRIKREFDSVERMLKETGSPTGTFTLVVPTVWVESVIFRRFNAFKGKYPGIDVTITSDLNIERHMAEEKPLIAVLPYTPEKSGYVRRLIKTCHTGLFASKSYLEQFGRPQTVADLDNHQLIANCVELHNEFNWHLKVGKKIEENERKPHICVDDPYYAIESGLGIGTLVTQNDLLNDSGFEQVLPDVAGPQVNIYLVYSEYLRDEPALKALVAFMLDLVQSFGG